MANSFKKNKKESIIAESLRSKKKVAEINVGNFKVSFQFLDTTQKYASSFKDWQKAGLLSKLLELLQGYCCSPLLAQIDGSKFSIYGDFPPKDKTFFTFPASVPEDAKWARIHVNGPAVVIGHVVNDTFYVVFLDKTHKFFLTKRITEN